MFIERILLPAGSRVANGVVTSRHVTAAHNSHGTCRHLFAADEYSFGTAACVLLRLLSSLHAQCLLRRAVRSLLRKCTQRSLTLAPHNPCALSLPLLHSFQAPLYSSQPLQPPTWELCLAELCADFSCTWSPHYEQAMNDCRCSCRGERSVFRRNQFRSGGSQRLGYLCRVSCNGAPSCNRQQRQDREGVALIFDSFALLFYLFAHPSSSH